MTEFTAIILAGGYGSRLGELGKRTAKPLLRLGGKTLLDLAVNKVREIDIKIPVLVLINSQFLNQYEQWIRGRGDIGLLTLVNNQESNQNVCPDIITNVVLTLTRNGISSDLLLIGGDNLFDFSLTPFVKFGSSHGVSTVVMDVGSREAAQHFSVVVLRDDGRIAELVEKPETPPSTLVTTCIYWFPGRTLQLFEEYTRSCQTAGSFGQFMQWLADKEPVYGFLTEGSWYDVGTIDVYHDLQRRFDNEPSERRTDES